MKSIPYFVWYLILESCLDHFIVIILQGYFELYCELLRIRGIVTSLYFLCDFKLLS